MYGYFYDDDHLPTEDPWVVGYFEADGPWSLESRHPTSDEAKSRATQLNTKELPEQKG